MGAIEKSIQKIKAAENPLPFNEVKRVCDHLFGAPRIRGSHLIYRTPWRGDPRINIQNRGGQVALYQVKQVAKAIARLEEEHD